MQLHVDVEQIHPARPIAVSRGTYTYSDVVVVRIEDGGHVGRGECCPLAHYGWSAEQVARDLHAMAGRLESLSRESLLETMPPGPARNALDCAMWDLEAKRTGRSAWEIAGIARPEAVATAITLMMAPPEEMAQQARDRQAFRTLKLKLGSQAAAESIAAVRATRPDAILSIDANEGWSMEQLAALGPVLRKANIAMVEQPLKAGADDALTAAVSPAPLCADESFHSSADLARVAGKYGFVNIKLDKCGGLTEALRILELAPAHGLRCMLGCMFATSLAIAPALLVAARSDFADLDGPLLLKADRPDGYAMTGDAFLPASSRLWGEPA